jgi:hypothetical protein
MQASLKPAKLKDYLAWLEQYLTHANPTDFFPNESFGAKKNRFWTVNSRFTLEGEKGGYAKDIIVLPGGSFLPEQSELGDNRLYFVKGGLLLSGATWVPVFNNPEFLKLQGIEQFIANVPAQRYHA